MEKNQGSEIEHRYDRDYIPLTFSPVFDSMFNMRLPLCCFFSPPRSSMFAHQVDIRVQSARKWKSELRGAGDCFCGGGGGDKGEHRGTSCRIASLLLNNLACRFEEGGERRRYSLTYRYFGGNFSFIFRSTHMQQNKKE